MVEYGGRIPFTASLGVAQAPSGELNALRHGGGNVAAVSKGIEGVQGETRLLLVGRVAPKPRAKAEGVGVKNTHAS